MFVSISLRNPLEKVGKKKKKEWRALYLHVQFKLPLRE